MIKDNFTQVRTYLISIGFVPVFPNGTLYNFTLPTNESAIFGVDFNKCIISAQYPDFKYNRSNPLSPKTTIVTEDFDKDADQLIIIHMIENFIDKISKIVERG